MRCSILVVDGFFGSAVASLIDILATADLLRSEVDASITPITVRTAADSEVIVSSSGLRLPVDEHVLDAMHSDVLVVPALGALDPGSLLAAMAHPQVEHIVDVISSATVPLIAGACTGTFPMAEAGILDGRRATTSWWLGAEFRRRYRNVQLETDRMVVADGPFLTAGAAFAHIDLALFLVATLSPILAQVVADVLVIDRRAAQGGYIALDMLVERDELVRAFEHHVRTNLGSELSIDEIALQIGTSARTLQRRVAEATGMTPISMIQRMRVDRARHLRQTTDLSIDRIAIEVGYRNASTLRALLRRYTPNSSPDSRLATSRGGS